ncbi:MAG TPA: PAS domain S-box protein [Solimonas sp.]|nr:PAS domain S-box protein [Solimonas sp.]
MPRDRKPWISRPFLLIAGFSLGLGALLPSVVGHFGPLVAALITLPLLLGGGWLLQGLLARGLRREVEELRHRLQRAAAGEEGVDLEPPGGGELHGFGEMFNQVLRQHREAEHELQASTALASSIVATAYDAYVAMNEAGCVTDWNRQAELVFGWSRSEVLGRPLAELIIPPRYRQAHRDGLQRYLRGGEARVLNQRIEISALTRDGREFPVELSIWATGSNGAQHFSAFLHDISERHRMLRRLAAQSAAASALLEAATLGEAMPAVLRAIGEALDWELGALWLLADRESMLHCAELWQRPGLDGAAFEAECRGTRFARGAGLPGRVWSEGQPAWIADVMTDANFPRTPAARQAGLHSAFAFPIFSDAQLLGVVEFFSATVQQPDEDLLSMMATLGNLLGQFLGRRIAETSLGKQREFVAALLENLADGIVACDEDGVLTVFNRATREFHGLPEEALPPERWAEHYDLYEADGRTRLLTARIPLYRAFAGESVRDAEIVIAPHGLPVRTVMCNGRPLVGDDGRKLGAVIAMQDITERRRAEAELAARAEELARSNEELERFAYIASHDLQEPLRTVASYTQLLLRRHRDGPAEERQFAGYITDAVHRMRALIEGLLSYSRAAQTERPPEPADLGKLVGLAVANLRGTIEDSAAQVDCGPLPVLTVNVAQIVQLFQNLVANALKFRGDLPPRVEIVVQRDGAYWAFSVRDNGIGIDEVHRQRIFTLFQRLHTSDAYPGSGIGLAICKRIVERHGGRIWVEAAQPGSRFCFTLPAE